MFTLFETYRGETFPLSIFTINDRLLPTTFRNITIQAERADEKLGIYEIAATMTFTNDPTTYQAPFTGTDFLTPQIGTLVIEITEELAADTYRIPLKGFFTQPSRCGDFLTGRGQAGRLHSVSQATTTFLDVQVLPSAWHAFFYE